MKHTILALIFALIGGIWSFAQTIESKGPNALVFTYDGKSLSFFLGSYPEWTPGFEKHTVKCKGSVYEFVNDEKLQVSFANEDFLSGIADAGSVKGGLKVKDNILTVIAADRPTELVITAINGVVLCHKTVASEESIDLNTLPSGAYIIKTAFQAIKYVRQ